MIRLQSKAPKSDSAHGLSVQVHRTPKLALVLAVLNACVMPACGSASHSSEDDARAGSAPVAHAGSGASSGAASDTGGSSGSGGSGVAVGGSLAFGGNSDGGVDGRSGSSNVGGSGHTGGAGGNVDGGSGHGGSSNGGTSGTSGTSGTGGNGTHALSPVIPMITGTCPTFATGTVTVAGLSGISIQAGPKMQGTGSLLFYWHGTGSSAAEVNALMPAAARQELLSQGGVIVSFQGSLSTGGDCSGTGTFSKDDFKVADLIAACAVRDYGVDPRRIYTTGCSAGGLQAGCMGALRSSYIAAAVPNSGGEVTQLPIQDPSRVPAVMTMHGGSSDMVVVSFATTSAAYDKQIKAAGGYVVNCNHGGGHCQAPAALYSAGWEFMKAHPFGVAPEPYASGLPAAFPSYCAAP